MAFRGAFADGLVCEELGYKAQTLAAVPITALARQGVVFAPASVAANTTAGQTVTCPGALTTDAVFVGAPGLVAGIDVSYAFVSATGVVTIVFANLTAGPLVPPSGIYSLLFVR